MFVTAARARHAILSNFRWIGDQPTKTGWRKIKMGIKRDLQAKRLRPNVAIPARRRPIPYLRAMYAETGSLADALTSYLHSGTWTSSGGSFKLAAALGYDFGTEIERRLDEQPGCRFVEVGGAWAGFRGGSGDRNGLAGLAQHFDRDLGTRLFLHFTNLTQWHDSLPKGVKEHPYVTAATLAVLTREGVPRGSVDIIHSQAGAYFETDPAAFVKAAATLLRPSGLLIFNHPVEASETISIAAARNSLAAAGSNVVGGMNGVVSAFRKVRVSHELIAEKHDRSRRQVALTGR